MERCASRAALAITAVALLACGSTTSTGADTPKRRDTVEVSQEPPPDAHATPSLDASPPAVPLAELLGAMKITDGESLEANDVIARLAELGLTVRCPTEGWKLGPYDASETAHCPGGPVQLSDVRGTLDIRVARRIDDDSFGATHIIVTGSGESAEWASRALSMLREARKVASIRPYTTKTVNGQKTIFIEEDGELDLATPYEVGDGVSAAVYDETGAPPRLELWSTTEPGLRY